MTDTTGHESCKPDRLDEESSHRFRLIADLDTGGLSS